ncbi:MAG: GntR family transcriptional regulator [Deltaproteobacteria bacterium]|nr:GntR family transcriptional regulator [Deltaproteobacteria bacterium]
MQNLRYFKIRPTNTIRERVYTQLRKAVLSGKIPTNERLVEGQLALQLGTSRTPIREALHKLELENLVSSIPRVGYIVKGLSEEDINDICEIRSVIEGLAVRRAISQITEKNLERLRKNIEQSQQAILQERLEKMVVLDTEFHDILCHSSGSKRIHELSQSLREYMFKFRVECLRTPAIASKAVIAHERIYRAICERDLIQAQKSVDDHLREVRGDIVNYYRSTEK